MRRIGVPEKARLRLYDKSSNLIADSELLDDSVEVGTLDPIITQETPILTEEVWWIELQTWTDKRVNDLPVFKRHREGKQRRLPRVILRRLYSATELRESNMRVKT